MKILFLLLISLCTVNIVNSQSNDSISYFINLANSNLGKTVRSQTVNFENVNFNSKCEAQLVDYISKFTNDSVLSIRQRAIEMVTSIGIKSKNQIIRTQTLNIYLQTFNFPGVYNFLNYFKYDDFNDSSKILLLKIFKRDVSELDIKMQRKYYFNLGREIYLRNFRDLKSKEAKEKKNSLDSLVDIAYNAQVEKSMRFWRYEEAINKDIIYQIGLLDIKEAIPLLNNALINKRYYKPALRIALARLGDKLIEKQIVDSLNLILLKSSETYEFTSPFLSLQYICTENSINVITGLLSLKTEVHPYSDGDHCKNIPIGFMAIKPLSEIISNFPIKNVGNNLDPWCNSMIQTPVEEYISIAKKWVKKAQGNFTLNRKLIVIPNY